MRAKIESKIESKMFMQMVTRQVAMRDFIHLTKLNINVLKCFGL